ncbi:uncharacterized protein FPRN_15240 [Fusarium proliferatum]|nr:uncharacterized protein FPRN_15240 [Fusarium proliferatum]
MARPLWRVF